MYYEANIFSSTFDDLIVAAIPGAHMPVFTVQVAGIALMNDRVGTDFTQ